MGGVLFEFTGWTLGWQLCSVWSTRSNMSAEKTEELAKKLAKAERAKKAEKAKTEGNKAFRAKDYEKALELYNIAIELDPEKVKYFSLQVISYVFHPRMPTLPTERIFT